MEIRPFGGTQEEAQGIIEVDRETFDDCEYTAEHICSLLADPRQRAWVAVEDGQVVGFASGFVTSSLATARWEVDELAVRPAYQGRGIGTRLVARAVLAAALDPGISEARALVARRNIASQRAFEKNGFSPVTHVDLLLYEVSGRVPRPAVQGLPAVHTATGEDTLAIAALTGNPGTRVAELIIRPDNTYLVAVCGQDVAGVAELIHVQTLQYEGLWLESLFLAAPDRPVAKALFGAAIEEAKRRQNVDRVGYSATPEDRTAYDACVSQGFHRIDAYSAYARRLDPR